MNHEKWLHDCYEPKQPSRLKIWWCKFADHAGQALYYLEQNQNVRKVKCLGCGTVFLEKTKELNNYEQPFW